MNPLCPSLYVFIILSMSSRCEKTTYCRQLSKCLRTAKIRFDNFEDMTYSLLGCELCMKYFHNHLYSTCSLSMFVQVVERTLSIPIGIIQLCPLVDTINFVQSTSKFQLQTRKLIPRVYNKKKIAYISQVPNLFNNTQNPDLL